MPNQKQQQQLLQHHVQIQINSTSLPTSNTTNSIGTDAVAITISMTRMQTAAMIANATATATTITAATAATNVNRTVSAIMAAQVIVSAYNHINEYAEIMSKGFGKSTEDDALSQKVIPEGKKQRAKNANVSLYSSTSAWEQLLASDKKNIPKHTVRNRALLTTNQIIVDKTSSNGVTL